MAEFMTGLKRTHYCGDLRISDVGSEVTVCGWVQRVRDLGQLIFIDLRDRTGIVQLAFNDETDREIFNKAFSCRSEFVLAAKGVVCERSAKNPDIPTGDIEITVTDLRVLSKAQTPPFEIVDDSKTGEDVRLKYRYLDLRRRPLQHNLMLRSKISKAARDYFAENGFIEIETPMMIKSTPEGARDYLVPSRIHNGKFYALPQSPQIYKQLLMLSGFDRYIQLARCFRDEDLRADRQPEFTQIDMELSFVDVEDILEINEGLFKRLFRDVMGVELPTPFARMSYADAMNNYGSDKPDVRFDMKIQDISDLVKDCGFGVFTGAIANGGSVRAIVAKDAAKVYTRKEIDKLTEFAKGIGAKGLAYVKNSTVLSTLGALRLTVAKRLNIIPDEFKFLWIVDFPFFEKDEESGEWVAMHHPFTMPKEECIQYLDTDPSKVIAKAFDLTLNGVELSSGSMRITDYELQQKMFRALKLEAYKYGAPPHGGMGIGLDRVIMLLCGADSLRDVTAFPKVQNASELMSACPSPVDQESLDVLGIQIKE